MVMKLKLKSIDLIKLFQLTGVEFKEETLGIFFESFYQLIIFKTLIQMDVKLKVV
jgi:NADH:ubiquinone oxidoreductase subunit C